MKEEFSIAPYMSEERESDAGLVLEIELEGFKYKMEYEHLLMMVDRMFERGAKWFPVERHDHKMGSVRLCLPGNCGLEGFLTKSLLENKEWWEALGINSFEMEMVSNPYSYGNQKIKYGDDYNAYYDISDPGSYEDSFFQGKLESISGGKKRVISFEQFQTGIKSTKDNHMDLVRSCERGFYRAVYTLAMIPEELWRAIDESDKRSIKMRQMLIIKNGDEYVVRDDSYYRRNRREGDIEIRVDGISMLEIYDKTK